MKSRISFITIILFFLVLSNDTFGYDVDVSGVVVNCCGEPLRDVLIEIPNTVVSCKTDSVGKFRLYGTRSKKVLRSNKSVQYDKVEYFDLHGRRIQIIKREQKNRIQSRLKPLANYCVIVKMTDENNQSDLQVKTLSNYNFKWDINAKYSSVKMCQGMFFLDSLRISKTGFSSRIITFNSEKDTIDTIDLTKILDESDDCGKNKTLSDSAKSVGYRVLKDSLVLSQAKYEWSARDFSVPAQSSKSRCIIDVSPWGLYSRYTLQGISGSYASIGNGYIVSSGLQNVSPVLTITGTSGGVELADGSTIDKSSLVVLYSGGIHEPNGMYRTDIPVMLAVRPRLPFDSLLLRTLYQIKSAEYAALFKDSAVTRKDTLIVKGNDVNQRTNANLINSHVIVDGTISDTTIITSGTMILKTGSILNRCMVMAANVVIQDGNTDGSVFYSFGKVTIDKGTHNSQFFSYDSIIIGQNVKTGPASLWVMRKTLQNDACIYFKKNRSICGTAIGFRDSWFSYPNISIYLDSGSVFTGHLITDGAIMTKYVDITGSIYTSSVETINGNVGYSNWLFGVSLHTPKTPLVFPLIGRDPINLNFIESNTTKVCY